MIAAGVVIIILLGSALSTYSAAADTPSPANDNARILTEGDKVADVNATKMRAGYQRNINDLIVLFGDKLPVSQACYQAAISNYIEDMWNGFANSFGCASNNVLCTKDPKAMENLATSLQKMGQDIHNDRERALGIIGANTWYIAAQIYTLLRQLHYQLDPEDEADTFAKVRHPEMPKEAKGMTEDEKKRQMDELKGYINSCDKRKPAAWSVVGVPFADNYLLTADAIKLGIQELLIEYLVTSQLPADDKGYVGCLHTLNSSKQAQVKCSDKACADTIPVDTKQDLTVQLGDLKSHQCEIGYAFQMQARAQPPATPPAEVKQ